MGLAIFADRFLVGGDGGALDLATGEVISLRPVVLAGRRAEERWATRCAALASMCHPHLVALADYGLAGKDRLFEAMALCAPAAPWRPRDDATFRALLSVVAFLHGQRRLAGSLSWSRVVQQQGGVPALLPDAATGTPWDDDGGTGEAEAAAAVEKELAQLARLVGRPVDVRRPFDTTSCDAAGRACRDTLDRLAEVLETGQPARPRAVRIPLPVDARRVVIVRQIARAARLRGYVPVASSLLDRPAGQAGRRELREALADRHVLLIHDPRRGGRDASVALFLVALGVSNSRPHVVALLGDSTRAALQARERPAEYVPMPVVTGRAEDRPALRLAGGEATRDAGAIRAQSNLAAAATLVATGRHAAAERMLRDGLGAFSRRGDGLGAGWAAAALGWLLLMRGRAAPAASFFETARQHFDRIGAAPAAGRCVVCTAFAWTDLGRLEEAEAASRAAGLAARETGDAWLQAEAGIALARCLLWQERCREGLEALEHDGAAAGGTPLALASKVAESRPPFEVTGTPADGVLRPALDHELARACLRARLCVTQGDLAQAGRAAVEARDRAAADGRPAAVAAAATSQLRVYAALGDVEAAERTLACGLRAAREAREPLRAVRLRIAWLDTLAQSGGKRSAAVARQLARLDRRALPWVVRRPLEQAVRAATSGAAAPPVSCPGRARVAGLIGSERAAPVPSVEWLLDDVAEILAVCQGPQDEETVLRAVTERVRRKHRLAILACVGLEEGARVVLASDGPPPVPDLAASRAIDAGRALAPDAFASGREAAVPVKYAGATVGALAARWAADVQPRWAHTGAVLAAAAAALAPAVRAVGDRRAAATLARGAPQDEILGVSEAAAVLRREVARAAAVPFSVLVEGESGTGKELVARALHQRGPRRHRRLCALNCAALSDELFEAELFGHARGAFTGAVTERKGLFEEADGGTLVLDEVGELTPRAQAKLLRAIQEGEIRRIGENFARAVDVRLVASTNRSLRAAVEEGRFRRDLLYRLDVVRIVVPPLRDRVEDIPVLAAHFWAVATARLGSRATLSPAAITALARYDWPGNIRELQNVLAALAVGAGKRGSVGAGNLPALIAGGAARTAITLEQARAVFEATYVRAALARNGNRRGDAARELGLTRQGLAKLLARLSIRT